MDLKHMVLRAPPPPYDYQSQCQIQQASGISSICFLKAIFLLFAQDVYCWMRLTVFPQPPPYLECEDVYSLYSF